MIGLALDTSYSYASIAMIDNGEILYYANNGQPNKQAETINTSIEDGLNNLRIEYQDLGYVAVTTGVGRFTGLRVGISVANAIHFALRLPLLPVSSFEAIAYRYKNKKIGIVLDAGIGKFYFQSFHCCKSSSDIKVITKSEVELLKEKYFLVSNVDIVPNKVTLDARDIAYCANYKYKQMTDFTSGYIKPLYVLK